MAANRSPGWLPASWLALALCTTSACAGGILSWEWVGPASSNIGGRVRAISIDSANGNIIVAAAAAGGIWRTTNAGGSWAPVNDFFGSLAVSSLTRDLNNTQTMYAGTGEGFLVGNARLDGKTPGVGVLKSTDGGTSWSPLVGSIGWAAQPGLCFVNRVAARGSRILAATNAGIMLSTDGGTMFDTVSAGWTTDLKWTRPPGGVLGDAAVAGLMTFCDDISCPTATPGPMVCAVFSDDGGQTWTPSTFTGMPVNALTATASAGATTLTIDSALPYQIWDIVKIGNSPGEYRQVAANGSGTTLSLRTGLGTGYPPGTPVVLVPSQRTELAVVKNFPNVVYATMGAGGGTIWKSSNGGRTFRFISNPSTDFLYNDNSARAFYDQVVWAAPNDSNVIVVAGVRVYRSTDGGLTLTEIGDIYQVLSGTGPHSDFHAIAEHPSYSTGTRTVYFGDDGGIHRAVDVLASTPTWQSVSQWLGATQFFGGAATKSGGVEWYMGGGQDNGRPHLRRRTQDPLDPASWVKPFDEDITVTGDGQNGAGDDKYAVAIDASDPQDPILYAVGAGLRIRRSTDQGDTWFTRSPPDSSGQLYAPFVLDPSEPSVLYGATSVVYRSKNRGESWQSIRGSQSGAPDLSALEVAPSDSNVMWIGYANGIVSYTTNARAASPTWFNVDGVTLPSRAVTDIAIDPQDPGHVFATFALPASNAPLDMVWQTVNWGQCWENRSGLPGFQLPRRRVLTVRVHPTDPDRVFVGTDLGVIASDDRGLTWNQNPLHPGTYASEGPANLEVWELLWQANEYLVAATNGRGMFRALPTPRALLFSDVSGASGTADPGNGQGVSWADYDRDGDLDLYVANHSSQSDKLFRNNGGAGFTDVTAAAGLTDAASSVSPVWADYDNDGDLDLYVTNISIANRLYRNNGNGTFTNVAAGSGTGLVADARGAAWADFDRDGRLDLYVVNVGANKLFHNGGGGVFTDSTTGPLGDASSGQSASWGDFDNDGDPDLFIANASHQADKLLRKDGGGFTDVSAAAGIADTSSGTAGAWGDYDNDGDLDLYVVNESGPNRLFRNNGNGTFTDVAVASRTDDPDGVGRGASWGDFDHDGDLDLYVSNFSGPNRLLRQDACGVFTDVTAMCGVASTTLSRATAWGDIDGDGSLDLYVSRSGANKLYREAGAAPSYHHWLHVDLVGTLSNRDGIGARILVVTGPRTQMREVSGGSGLYSQESLTAEFGLGTATGADQVQVRWPSGVVQTLTSVAGDQRITITEPGPTGVPGETLPSAFALEPPVPNPFSRGTSLRFSLPVAAHVKLKVYDLAGRRIRVLADEQRPAGTHALEWDGNDAAGRAVGPGIYFVRFEAPGFQSVRRMMRVR